MSARTSRRQSMSTDALCTACPPGHRFTRNRVRRRRARIAPTQKNASERRRFTHSHVRRTARRAWSTHSRARLKDADLLIAMYAELRGVHGQHTQQSASERRRFTHSHVRRAARRAWTAHLASRDFLWLSYYLRDSSRRSPKTAIFSAVTGGFGSLFIAVSSVVSPESTSTPRAPAF